MRTFSRSINLSLCVWRGQLLLSQKYALCVLLLALKRERNILREQMRPAPRSFSGEQCPLWHSLSVVPALKFTVTPAAAAALPRVFWKGNMERKHVEKHDLTSSGILKWYIRHHWWTSLDVKTQIPVFIFILVVNFFLEFIFKRFQTCKNWKEPAVSLRDHSIRAIYPSRWSHADSYV